MSERLIPRLHQLMAKEPLVPFDSQTKNNDHNSSPNMENRKVPTEEEVKIRNADHETKSTLNVALADGFQTCDVVVKRDR